MELKRMIELSKEARELSYSPYSHFKVGALLVTKDDRYFKGANIENASYSLCMCAERNAIYNAYLNGVKKEDITHLIVIADTPTPCSPCGACRQVIDELLPKDAKIVLVNMKGDYKETNKNELLPFSFSSEDMK